jgi:hypothetical protein
MVKCLNVGGMIGVQYYTLNRRGLIKVDNFITIMFDIEEWKKIIVWAEHASAISEADEKIKSKIEWFVSKNE